MAENDSNAGSGRTERFASAKNPWLGLGAYKEGQQLYGRDKETAELSDIIINHTASVVYGKSGIGKSSLLRAGVFPELRRNGMLPIYLRLVHNTETSYVLQIENAIREKIILQDLLPSDIPDLGLWDFLHRNRFTDDEGQRVTPVIVLDQFEEIFTLTDVEHKADVQALFTELADVLNDVKPDRVIEAEAQYAKATSEGVTSASGFTLQSFSKTALKYDKSPSFRFVFSLRDDSLYLLERNSAKIPAIKVNRYNLCALDEVSAMEVIMKPSPDLFTDKEGRDILDGLAYYEYNEYRVVNPAILSLYLYSYYNEHGNASFEEVFKNYYEESIRSVNTSSIKYLEENLLTEDGYRIRLPKEQLLNNGVSAAEIEHLKKCIILKVENGYVEFSHDLLCKEALRHKGERIKERAKKRMKALTGAFVAVLAVILGVVWLLWPAPPIEMVTLNLMIKDNGSFAKGESWNADFCFLSFEKDSMLSLPIRNKEGMALENLRIYKDGNNSFQLTIPQDFIEREGRIRIALFNTSGNCRADTTLVDLRQWYKKKNWLLTVERIPKIIFAGQVVDEEGQPVEKAMILMGDQPMQLTGSDGFFRFFVDDTASLTHDLYVFKQGYEGEHLLGGLVKACSKGSSDYPMTIAIKSNINTTSDIDYKRLFLEQRYASVSLYRLAGTLGNNMTQADSARLDSVIKVYPQYALNLKKLKRKNKMTTDGKLDVYCVYVENPKVKNIRDVIGNYLLNGQDYLFKGKLIQVERNDTTRWRLSAISWDKDNHQYFFQGIMDNMASESKHAFILEEEIGSYTP